MVKKVGFVPIGEAWPSCYMNARLKLLLVLYVDDFKLAGPCAAMEEGWRLLRQHLTIEPATPVGLYLGCRHEVSSVTAPGYKQTLMTYNVEGFLESCVKRYEELSGGNARLRTVSAPQRTQKRDPPASRRPIYLRSNVPGATIPSPSMGMV